MYHLCCNVSSQSFNLVDVSYQFTSGIAMSSCPQKDKNTLYKNIDKKKAKNSKYIEVKWRACLGFLSVHLEIENILTGEGLR